MTLEVDPLTPGRWGDFVESSSARGRAAASERAGVRMLCMYWRRPDAGHGEAEEAGRCTHRQARRRGPAWSPTTTERRGLDLGRATGHVPAPLCRAVPAAGGRGGDRSIVCFDGGRGCRGRGVPEVLLAAAVEHALHLRCRRRSRRTRTSRSKADYMGHTSSSSGHGFEPGAGEVQKSGRIPCEGASVRSALVGQLLPVERSMYHLSGGQVLQSQQNRRRERASQEESGLAIAQTCRGNVAMQDLDPSGQALEQPHIRGPVSLTLSSPQRGLHHHRIRRARSPPARRLPSSVGPRCVTNSRTFPRRRRSPRPRRSPTRPAHDRRAVMPGQLSIGSVERTTCIPASRKRSTAASASSV